MASAASIELLRNASISTVVTAIGIPWLRNLTSQKTDVRVRQAAHQYDMHWMIAIVVFTPLLVLMYPMLDSTLSSSREIPHLIGSYMAILLAGPNRATTLGRSTPHPAVWVIFIVALFAVQTTTLPGTIRIVMSTVSAMTIANGRSRVIFLCLAVTALTLEFSYRVATTSLWAAIAHDLQPEFALTLIGGLISLWFSVSDVVKVVAPQQVPGDDDDMHIEPGRKLIY